MATEIVAVGTDADLPPVEGLQPLAAMPFGQLLVPVSLWNLAVGTTAATAGVGIVSLGSGAMVVDTADVPVLGVFRERPGLRPTHLWLPVVSVALVHGATSARDGRYGTGP